MKARGLAVLWENPRCVAGTALLMIAVTAMASVPAGRHFALYSLLPLAFFALAVAALDGRVPFGWLAAGLFAGIAGLHLFNALYHPVHLEPDSRGYIAWAQAFAHGRGFPGMIYRAPGYPFILGLTFLSGSQSLLPAVLLQHAALVVASFMVFLLATACGFGRRTALFGSALFGCNSLVMQIGQWIMTESFFTLLITSAAFALVKMLRRPSAGSSALCAACFAAADLFRPMLLPLFALSIVAVVARNRGKALVPVLAAAGVYAAVTLPWMARNAYEFGEFALAGGQGIQVFTKAVSYNLHANGPAGRALEPALQMAAHDLGVNLDARPEYPEDDWPLNQVPHALADSLVSRNKYSFVKSDRLLRRAAFEAFAAHLPQYAAAIGRACAAMLFTHREMFPRIDAVLPVRDERLPAAIERLLRGLLYVPGILLIVFPVFALLCRGFRPGMLTPFLFAAYGYAATAAVQVGFTRYTIPWTGFSAIIAAFVVLKVLEWTFSMLKNNHVIGRRRAVPHAITPV